MKKLPLYSNPKLKHQNYLMPSSVDITSHPVTKCKLQISKIFQTVFPIELFIKVAFLLVFFDNIFVGFLKVFGQDDVTVLTHSLHTSLKSYQSKYAIAAKSRLIQIWKIDLEQIICMIVDQESYLKYTWSNLLTDGVDVSARNFVRSRNEIL